MFYRQNKTSLVVTILSVALGRLAGAESYDLSRMNPVPANEPVPVVDFFRPLVLQQPALNISGTHVAAIVTAGEDQHLLFVYDVKSKQIETVGGVGDMDISGFSWLNDRRLIFSLSARKMYGLGLFAAEVGSIGDPYVLLQYYGSRLVAVPPQHRLEPLVWNSRDFETRKDLGVASLNTGIRGGKFVNALGADATHSTLMDARDNNERHLFDRHPAPSTGLGVRYLADREGKLDFAITMQDGIPALLRLVDQEWEKCPVALEQVEIIGHGDDRGQLVVRGPRQAGKPRALQFLDGATGKLGQVLLQDEAYDFYGSLYRDPVNHLIIGAVFERNGPTTVWFNEEYRNLQQILEGYFPGVVVQILGSDEAQKKFLVATFSDRQAVRYYMVDLAKRTFGLFKDSEPWIDPKRMQPVNIIQFKTRDGRRLDAYLTLPAGASKDHPPPLVVLPHGGPWVRDSWGFYARNEAQFLASRGYAVLQPNYRGSEGYDWMFPPEDLWDFRKMNDDVTDATRLMIASKLIDGSRVAIMGGSFGGYLAITGVENEPNLYRCAVTIAGVFDWAEAIKDRKYNQFDDPFYGRLLRKLGDPAKQPEKFDAISPGRHVDRIRVPVFVAHGKDDPISDISQSRRLVAELEKHHVPYEALLVSEEGHGMGHLTNEVELYTRIEAFLAKYLAPATAGPSGAP